VNRCLAGLVVLAATVSTFEARAQEEPGSEPILGVPPAAPPPAVTDTATTTDTSSVTIDPAWERYHDAFLAVLAGDRDRGREILQSVIDDFGTHPATDFAAELLATIPPKAPPPPPPPPTEPAGPKDPFAPEGPSPLARAELATFQTLYGITAGGLICGAAECDDARVIVSLLALGGGGGLALSLYATRNGITPGRAQTINAASGWGIFNGIALASALDMESNEAFATVLLGQGAGVLTGIAINSFRDPRGGDVSRATSFGLWASTLTLYAHGLADFEADSTTLWTSLLIAADFGLAIGGALNYKNIAPMTRGRVLLIDAGGLVGGLLGMGSVVLIKGDVGDGKVFFTAAILGTLGGLGLTTYVTRAWDAPDDVLDVTVGIAPDGQGGGSFVVGGRF
jgi:hypothetical protein